jgi:glyoxalase family protein
MVKGISWSLVKWRAEKYLSFTNPDGLQLSLVETNDQRTPWTTDEVNSNMAIRGFRTVTLTVRDVKPTADVLTAIFGYRLLK